MLLRTAPQSMGRRRRPTLSQSVVVSGSSRSLRQARRARPVRFALVVTTLRTHALVPHVAANVPYDPVHDFTALSNLFRSINAVWVSPALDVRTLPDFVAYAKARPGQLDYARGGVGSSNHTDVELFTAATGVRSIARST